MRPIQGIRRAIATGSLFSLVFLFPIVLFGVMWANLAILFHKMGWPLWIVWVIVVLLFLGLDGLFYLAYVVGIIAGFFYTGVWPWSLLAIGMVVVAHLVWWALFLLGAVAQPKDESEFDINTGEADQPISAEDMFDNDDSHENHSCPLSDKAHRKSVHIILGDSPGNWTAFVSRIIENAFGNEYDIQFKSYFFDEEIIECVQENDAQIFIIIVENIHFMDNCSPNEHMGKSIELINYIRQVYKKPVIACSGCSEEYLLEKTGRKLIPDYYFSLPFDVDEFIGAIRECIESLGGKAVTQPKNESII